MELPTLSKEASALPQEADLRPASCFRQRYLFRCPGFARPVLGAGSSCPALPAKRPFSSDLLPVGAGEVPPTVEAKVRRHGRPQPAHARLNKINFLLKN